ncbi:hypothetical protein ACTXT7_004627 [Hymenolepis weldensis]
MSTCRRFFMNLCRSRKRDNLLESGPRGKFNPNYHQRDTVGSVNPTCYGVNAMNDDNQNNAFSNSPVPTMSQSVSTNGNQSDCQDPVRTMVIALPGPGVNIPNNHRSCPPLDVTQEIEGLDTTSTITENSDSEWNYMRANQRKVYNMDPLQPPLISKYEWEYKNDINQRMRVPDKLSVATSLPNLDSSKHHGGDCKDNVVSSIGHHEATPGYSPDLLINNEAQPDLVSLIHYISRKWLLMLSNDESHAILPTLVGIYVGSKLNPSFLLPTAACGYVSTSKARDIVDASTAALNNAQASEMNTLVSRRNPADRLRLAENRLSNLEIHVARLSSRLRTLEQQQAILGGIISIYFGLKIQASMRAPQSLSMSFPTERLPTGPTEADIGKKNRFRRNLKIIFIVFCLLTTVFLAVGIYLAVDPGRHIYGLGVFGYILIALGNVALITSIASGNLFFRLAYTLSESKVYSPKQADQLRSKPYPRQPDGIRRRRVPVIHTDEEAVHSLPTSQPSRISGRSSIDINSRAIDILPTPSAPSEEAVSNHLRNYYTPNDRLPSTNFMIQDRMRNNVEGNENEVTKLKMSAAPSEMLLPFPPLDPDVPPPPYEENP